MIFLTYFILSLQNIYTLTQLVTEETLLPGNPFVSIWNAPTEGCKRFGVQLNLSYFDIVANKNDTFEGDEIVIFYSLGVFPRYTHNNETINGGIPQLGNPTLHLAKVQKDIEKYIPKKTFTGLAVIDWEDWRPIYERNHYNKPMRIYIEASESLVRKEHPDWPEDKIRRQAAEDFELAARKFMLTTLQLCENLRPQGKWGYYGFPNCYNYALGQKSCSNRTMFDNDRLAWMFGNSGAIMPSIYLSEHFGTAHDRRISVYGRLKEALRVKGNNSRAAILPYSRFIYVDTKNFYSWSDLINTIQQSADAGLAGISLWAASASFETKAQCEATRDFIDTSLGPVVKDVTRFASDCSTKICHSHGRCVRRDWRGTGQRYPQHSNRNEEGDQISRNSKSISLSRTRWWSAFSFGLWDFVTRLLTFFNLDTQPGETQLPCFSKRFEVKMTAPVASWEGIDFDCRCYIGWYGEFCQNKIK